MRDTRHWCILRTSGQRTLALAASLSSVGIETWTPLQVTFRAATKRKARQEVRSPIMPTFVFARASALPDLVRILAMPVSPHPDFSIFTHAGRVPLISDRDVGGLRAAEAAAAAVTQLLLDQESRRQRDVERIALLKTLKAQRKALRAEHHDFPIGTFVEVTHLPAFAGLLGEVIESGGNAAVVSFGGALSIKNRGLATRPDSGITIGNTRRLSGYRGAADLGRTSPARTALPSGHDPAKSEGFLNSFIRSW